MQKVIKNTNLEPISTDILKLDNEIVPGSYDVPTTHAVAKAIDGVVPQNSYTALASNTMMPLNVGDNGILTNNGINLTVTGLNAWAEGGGTTASGTRAHAEGGGTTASGARSHAEGDTTVASGNQSHAEGYHTEASGGSAHAEGGDCVASGVRAHAEGGNTVASGERSHAEGNYTTATEKAAHAEGDHCTASSANAHAGGNYSTAGGANSFVHGNNLATTKSNNAWFGQFNADEDVLLGVGNGTDDNARGNAFKVDKNGDLWGNVAGTLANISKIIYNGSGSEITETPPAFEYTPGNLYIITGVLMRCVSYTVSDAVFVETSLIEEHNNNE